MSFSLEKVDELTANATVKSVEFLGDEKIVYAKMAHNNVEIAAVVASDAEFKAYDTILVSAADKALLFNHEGVNITQMEAVVNA